MIRARRRRQTSTDLARDAGVEGLLAPPVLLGLGVAGALALAVAFGPVARPAATGVLGARNRSDCGGGGSQKRWG